MSELAATPEPPYYAVILTSRRAAEHEGYGEMADRMVELAQPKDPASLDAVSPR